jgi:hypothetical protein
MVTRFATFYEMASRLLLEITFAALFTALIYLLYRRYPALSTKVIGRFHVSASRITPHILAAGLLPLVLRLALLPWLPPPEPQIHDEFGHLLVADTLIAGRLANPPHPLWRHLETIYVLQQPTYSSIYPIGQGIILAAGKALIGHPWAGVLLSTGLMCGATSWMLFGCLPPTWAAVGGLLAALAYGVATYWVESYWGGAFCAFGGALLFGAVCRLRKSPSKAMGLVAGLGWSIVWLIRPFESLLLFIFSWGFIAAFMIRDPQPRRRWSGPIVLVLSVQILAGFITALHNRAVTGSFTTLPYHLSQQAYGVPQSLLWQRTIELPAFRFAELEDIYWWQWRLKKWANEHPIRQYGVTLLLAWSFFVTPWFSVPIVLLPLLLKDRDIFVCTGMIACAFTASVLYPFFFPHYIAAYSCIIFFLIIQGMMMLYQWSFRGKAVGRLVTLFLILGGLLMGLRMVPMEPILGLSSSDRRAGFREQVSERLMGLGGRHVVFVRYGANRGFHDEWVYNAADIDASQIVWCRAMGPTDDVEVTHYYKDRQMWVVEVDGDAVRVSHYQPGMELAGSELQAWVLERQSQVVRDFAWWRRFLQRMFKLDVGHLGMEPL